jgi:hypothetical protein
MSVWEFSLAVTFRNVEDHFTWDFVGVYGPNSNKDRRLFWDELVGMLSCWNLPWCIGGAFNVTRFPCERSVEARLCPTMVEFFDFIFDQGLMDIFLVSRIFT